jgi:hypothetical protein
MLNTSRLLVTYVPLGCRRSARGILWLDHCRLATIHSRGCYTTTSIELQIEKPRPIQKVSAAAKTTLTARIVVTSRGPVTV